MAVVAPTVAKKVSLSDVAVIDKTKHTGELPYVGLEDISNATGEFLGSHEPRSMKSTTFRFGSDHVLYGRLRPYLNKALLPDFEGHCSSEIFPIRPCKDLDRRYLFYWLTWQETCNRIAATETGARMPRANMKEVMAFDIPLPPLEEQKRIVAVLDQAFAAVDRACNNATANLTDSRTLSERFIGAVFSSVKSAEWGQNALRSLSKIKYGHTEKAQTQPVGPKFLRITDIQEGRVDWATVPYCKATSAELQKYDLKKGDIVFARTGATTGKSFLIANPPQAVFASYLIRLRPDSSIIHPPFLYHYFQSDQYWNAVRVGISGSAQGGFNASKLGEIKIPAPNLDRQKRIANILDIAASNTDALYTSYQYQIAQTEALRQSLLKKAFAGELA